MASASDKARAVHTITVTPMVGASGLLLAALQVSSQRLAKSGGRQLNRALGLPDALKVHRLLTAASYIGMRGSKE